MDIKKTLKYAQTQDDLDPLKKFRSDFHFPLKPDGTRSLYFAGHSLGLQPKRAKEYIVAELEDWAKFGVEGHFHARHPWLPYHEFVTNMLANLVGAEPIEVVMMNTLTVNLHLMMISFYRPTKQKYKIIIEGGAFPSDQYAVQSQIKLHGLDPKDALIELYPRPGEHWLRLADIVERIEKEGPELALVMIGNANYLTGQAFDMQEITRVGHRQGAFVGFDLAHGAGNLKMNLHASGADFAVWCSYKYLNSGPGGLAGCFVHSRHAHDFKGPRLQGWWGQNKATRFKMEKTFDPIPGVEAWQLSNPPIFQLAAIRASLELFDEAGMARLSEKGANLTSYLAYLIDELKFCEIVTPREVSDRGNLMCIKVKDNARALNEKLVKMGVHCDFREPDIIRFTPIPLYNNHQDIFELWEILASATKN